ncbi:FGGY-family carbohydrate kinase [Oleiharenicola lentus]|uniref:FGGY-family carbohydrate kinase n=1 Tax=Oleiharenicola lentus TaxID=2508720 RepID=UPI003F661193
MALFLGIDLGTSYFKIGVFDATGALKGLSRIGVEAVTSAGGRRELPVGWFWQALRRGLVEALAEAKAQPAEIAGLSYSSQANTFLLLDESDQPLTPLILWTDQRAAGQVGRLVALSDTPGFGRTVGFEKFSEAFAVAKYHWFQAHEPEVWAKARRIMTISDYLTFALTGNTAGDASTAALLGLYDLKAENWWPAALQVAGLAAHQLSQPLRPGTWAGTTGRNAMNLLGLPPGVPFAVGGLDHHVAALGSGIGRLATVSISTGTALAAMKLVPDIIPGGGCFHGPHFSPGVFFRLAFDANGAGQLEDYRRGFAASYSIEQLIALASHADGLAPVEPRDRAHGLAIRHLMEEISQAHRRLVSQIAGEEKIEAIVATGGGSRSPVWLQMMADVIGIPIVAPASSERACLGAAILATVAAGTHASIDEASSQMVHRSRVFTPSATGA